MAKSPEAFRTISEVAEWLQVPTHVLRFWESRFAQVKPVKRAGGRRYYRPSDMELLGGIKKLLHDDGLTIRGVQKLLREEGIRHVAALSPENVSADAAGSGRTASAQEEARESEGGTLGDAATVPPRADAEPVAGADHQEIAETGKDGDPVSGGHADPGTVVTASADEDGAPKSASPAEADVAAPELPERGSAFADLVADPDPATDRDAVADPAGIDDTDPAHAHLNGDTDPAPRHVDLTADAAIPGISVLLRLSLEEIEAHRGRLEEVFDRAQRLRRSMGETDG